ncbi:MAG: 5-formyltetrahydrofolate cyclo-ligase [Candidatus Aenigmarchaeota archaeon]|nr:5-formyltetrahydrofolate cyclo-ligase [Candidatus Aenigmarchaeota archaeon]
MKTKAHFREEILSKRNALSKDEIDAKSTVIAMRLLDMPEFMDAKTIFAYASYNSEVSTKYFIKKALNLGKKVCVPKVDFKTGDMWPVLISAYENLKPNENGIPEPGRFAASFDPMKVDLILVPGSVFDLQGHRIGSGKGFYDKYLHTYKNHAAVIGLAFDFQIVDDIPEEPHDKEVHKIITEKRIINCKIN